MTDLHAVSFLEYIDAELNSRIAELKKLNARYTSILRVLEPGASSITDDDQSCNYDKNDDTAPCVSDDTSESKLPAALDDILLRAKSIRSRQPSTKVKTKKDTKQRQGHVPSQSLAETVKPHKNDDERDMKAEGKPHRVTMPVQVKKKNNVFALIHSQVKLLDSAHLVDPFVKTLPSRSLIISETRLLSALSGRPCLPPSSLLRIVDASDWPRPCCCSNQRRMYTAAMTYMRSARANYEKALKSKLNRMSARQLHDDDLRQVFVWWLNMRRCVGMHHALERGGGLCTCSTATADSLDMSVDSPVDISSGGGEVSADVPRLAALVSDMTKPVMPLTPLTHPPIVLRGQGQEGGKCGIDRVWTRLAARMVSDYHRAVQSRVRYAAETVISKLVLKKVIHEIKECCQLSASNEGSNESLRGPTRTSNGKDAQLLQKWMKALQQFQSVEACLLHEAAAMATTMFFVKKKV